MQGGMDRYIKHKRTDPLEAYFFLHRLTLLITVHTHAAQGGMDRYIKRKRTDPLESYIPGVLVAQAQLLLVPGVVESEGLAAARDLLRKGAFVGLRDNVRAIAEFATPAVGAADAKGRQVALFTAIENLDLTIFNVRPVRSAAAKLGLFGHNAAAQLGLLSWTRWQLCCCAAVWPWQIRIPCAHSPCCGRNVSEGDGRLTLSVNDRRNGWGSPRSAAACSRRFNLAAMAAAPDTLLCHCLGAIIVWWHAFDS